MKALSPFMEMTNEANFCPSVLSLKLTSIYYILHKQKATWQNYETETWMKHALADWLIQTKFTVAYLLEFKPYLSGEGPNNFNVLLFIIYTFLI